MDFLWPAHRLIVETDGYAAHSRPADFERDHERDARLREAHHKVLRFTYRQMTEKPGWVAGNVRSELSRSRVRLPRGREPTAGALDLT